MFRLMNEKRSYEMKCEKGYFILEIEDIEETVCNTDTGMTSKMSYELHYRVSKNCGVTTYLIGGYIPVTQSEKDFIEEELDFILESDYFVPMIEYHKRELEILKQRFDEEFFNDEEKDQQKKDDKIKKGLDVIKYWLEQMEHQIIKLDESEVITYDQLDKERTENDTAYWCEWIIETLESRLINNPDMGEDVIQQYNEEINLLKILGGLE